MSSRFLLRGSPQEFVEFPTDFLAQPTIGKVQPSPCKDRVEIDENLAMIQQVYPSLMTDDQYNQLIAITACQHDDYLPTKTDFKVSFRNALRKHKELSSIATSELAVARPESINKRFDQFISQHPAQFGRGRSIDELVGLEKNRNQSFSTDPKKGLPTEGDFVISKGPTVSFQLAKIHKELPMALPGPRRFLCYLYFSIDQSSTGSFNTRRIPKEGSSGRQKQEHYLAYGEISADKLLCWGFKLTKSRTLPKVILNYLENSHGLRVSAPLPRTT